MLDIDFQTLFPVLLNRAGDVRAADLNRPKGGVPSRCVGFESGSARESLLEINSYAALAPPWISRVSKRATSVQIPLRPPLRVVTSIKGCDARLRPDGE